mmetsp:Transcript_47329/g.118412  ORF Transcript_47329/g.118412 Transcript_47329/m.118412 type:complete len:248 (-) Transcript_47329:120-863(-)
MSHSQMDPALFYNADDVLGTNIPSNGLLVRQHGVNGVMRVINSHKHGSAEATIVLKHASPRLIAGVLQPHEIVTLQVRNMLSEGNILLRNPKIAGVILMRWNFGHLCMENHLDSEVQLHSQIAYLEHIALSLHKDLITTFPPNFVWKETYTGWCQIEVSRCELSHQMYLTVRGEVGALKPVCSANLLDVGGVCVVDYGIMTSASGVRVEAFPKIVDAARSEGLRVWSYSIGKLCSKGVPVSVKQEKA